MPRKTKKSVQEASFQDHERSKTMQEYAQIAYEVHTQEEMLGFPRSPKFKPPEKNADPVITHEMDDVLYEAAQQGNIGGG